MPQCGLCEAKAAVTRQPLSGKLFCAECFCTNFEDEVHKNIQTNGLIPPGTTVVVGVSGGKDSSVLLIVLYKIIFERYSKYYAGVKLKMCAVDEGIAGYRKESLDVVHKLYKLYGLELQVVSFQERFGRALDHLIQKELYKGDLEDVRYARLACSYCGIMRRSSLNYGASVLSENAVVATGHNADDYAETVLLNLMRGDFAKLKRCVGEVVNLGVGNPKVKPLSKQSQKDVILYAHYAYVPYFSTECPYAATAQRGIARKYLQRVSAAGQRRAVLLVQEAVGDLRREGGGRAAIAKCPRCGAPLAGTRCQACLIRDAQDADMLRAALKCAQQQ